MVFSDLEFFQRKNDVKIYERFQVLEGMKKIEVNKALFIKPKNHRAIKIKKGRIKNMVFSHLEFFPGKNDIKIYESFKCLKT